MTREETKKAIEIMQEYVDGGEVETYSDNAKKFIEVEENKGYTPSWNWGIAEYRIKPKEENEYWDCPQDVVIGAVYRLKGKIQILYASFFNDRNISIGNRICNWENIHEYEYSLDGKTWQECLK